MHDLKDTACEHCLGTWGAHSDPTCRLARFIEEVRAEERARPVAALPESDDA